MPMTSVREVGRTTAAAQLLGRSDFAKRLAANEPVSMLELLYPLLQGYDSVAVRADAELGGTDQKFNLLLGRDIQRAYSQPEQAILTMPILVPVDGHRKMSKSSGTQGGVTLGDIQLAAGEHDVALARADGQVLKVGRRRFRRLRAG